MPEPWFDASRYAWIFGTFIGILGATLGPLAGHFANKGRRRRLVVFLYSATLAYCAICFIAGLVAYFTGQPYGVWYGLGMAGVIGIVVFVPLFFVVLNLYRQAELRRSNSLDL